MDRIHHGARNPTSIDVGRLVFDVLSPDAFRDNARQSALDVVQLVRLIGSLTVPTSVIGGQDDAEL